MEDNIWFGIIGEKFAIRVVRSLFPKKLGFSYAVNDFRKYNMGHGLDLLVYQNGVPFLAVEVKNLHERKDKSPYGFSWAKSEVLGRFWDEKDKFPIKILFTTYDSNHSKNAIKLFNGHGLNIFTTGKFIESKDLPQKGNNNKFFYSIRNRFQNFIEELRKQQKRFLGFNCVYNGCNNTLDNYTSINSTNTLNNIINPYTQNEKTNKIPLKVVPEFSFEKYCRDMAVT